MRKFLLSAAACAAAALLLGGCKAEDGAAGPRAASNVQATGANPATPADEKNVRRVGPAELQKMLESGEAVAVDVRVKGEFDRGHIKGSLSIPRDQLPTRLGELPKDKLIVFYCAWPTEHQSAGAALDIKPKGVENTAALLGGWNAWTAQGLPTEKQ